MIVACQREFQVRVERHGKVAHRAAAFANPTAFGRGECAFYRIMSMVAVRHCRVKEDKEVAVAVVFKMPQSDAERIEA